ncbi:hypothetical protein PGIGA_G00244400 [Pangasianodon gigas]|uniref:Uncharacterized protein n=1 Tax=Pangasianodon gigas TaxID=30993 RepID=A0ACC5WQ86_PANGG|nr:hypothetical protein [Pangasianodon gigas]
MFALHFHRQISKQRGFRRLLFPLIGSSSNLTTWTACLPGAQLSGGSIVDRQNGMHQERGRRTSLLDLHSIATSWRLGYVPNPSALLPPFPATWAESALI